MGIRFLDILRKPVVGVPALVVAATAIAATTLVSSPKPVTEAIPRTTPRPSAGPADVQRGNTAAAVLAGVIKDGCDTVYKSIKGGHFADTDTTTSQYHLSQGGYVVFRRIGQAGLVQTFFAAQQGTKPVRAACALNVTYLEFDRRKDCGEYASSQTLRDITHVNAIQITRLTSPTSDIQASAFKLKATLADDPLDVPNRLDIYNQGTDLHPFIHEPFTAADRAFADRFAAFARSVMDVSIASKP